MNIFFATLFLLISVLTNSAFLQVSDLTKRQKNRASKAIREYLSHKKINKKFERKIIVVLPDISKHQGDFIKEVRMC